MSNDDVGAPFKRKLTVTSSKLVREGVGAKGPWKLQECEVRGEDGQVIAEKFKTFGEPKINELVEYEIQKQVSEKYGQSFLLKIPGGGNAAGLGKSVDDLRERVERLESQVAGLLADPRASGPVADPPSMAPAGAAPTSDDDIPF